MFATARLASGLAFAAAVLGAASPVFASGLMNDKPPVITIPAAIPSSSITERAPTRPAETAVQQNDEALGGSGLRRGMYVSFAALQVMDAISTRKALSRGAREANPAMAGIAGNSAAMFAVKAGTAAATAYFTERLARNHPRRATIFMAVLNTAYVAVVAHNYRTARNR